MPTVSIYNISTNTYVCQHTLHAKSVQLYLTLCGPMDGGPPGSSVHGILQARMLEWVAISLSTTYSVYIQYLNMSVYDVYV